MITSKIIIIIIPKLCNYTLQPLHNLSLQVLLTGNDFANASSHQNLLNTMNALINMKVVPIMNGNDTVAPPPQISADLKDVNPIL